MVPSPHRIFVSHSHLDNEFGTKLVQDLRQALQDESAIWYDVLGGLQGGDTWWEKIVEELTACDVFLLVLSPDAMDSYWVRREINIALNLRKFILPVHCRPCTIRADLQILQIISFLPPKPYEAALQEVFLALGLPTETPLTRPESANRPPDQVATLIQQIEESFAVHDWADVIRKADYLINRTPASVPVTVYRLQGLAFMEEGEEQRAQGALETALALVSNRDLRLTLLSDYTALLARQEQWAQVLQRTKEALRLVPNDPGWLATQQQAESQLSMPTSAASTQQLTQGLEPDQQGVEIDMPTSAASTQQLTQQTQETAPNLQVRGTQLEGREIGHFQIRKLIGHGAIGDVYFAVDPRIQQEVAIKVVQNVSEDAENQAEFRREAREIARLRHPRIVRLFDYDVITIDGTASIYLVTQYYKEGSLAQWLQRRESESLSLEEAKHFIVQAADALQYAHNLGIVHRNVKPSNFLIDTEGITIPNRPNLLLTDFRITEAIPILDREIVEISEIAYEAPEQYGGLWHSTYASDQYALAIVAYELLTGHLPFQGSLGDIIHQHISTLQDPPSAVNSKVPKAIDSVILRALEKKTEDRFASIEDFSFALQRGLN